MFLLLYLHSLSCIVIFFNLIEKHNNENWNCFWYIFGLGKNVQFYYFLSSRTWVHYGFFLLCVVCFQSFSNFFFSQNCIFSHCISFHLNILLIFNNLMYLMCNFKSHWKWNEINYNNNGICMFSVGMLYKWKFLIHFTRTVYFL